MAGAPPSSDAVAARAIRKRFGTFAALDGVSLDIAPGEFVTILGPSGCGKTTLLRVIAGLEEPDEGQVAIGGVDVTDLPPARRGCGIVFQSYALFPNLTAQANVAYGIRGLDRAARAARAAEMLALVQLPECAPKYPAQLSGGQQQRVALARALAVSPRVLLLDEPLSALDAKVRVRLRQEIRSLQQRLGLTTIMVTHDQEEALTMSDRVLVLRAGRLVQYAAPRDLYDAPADPFVADFVGRMNFLGGFAIGPDGRATRGALALDLAGPPAAAGPVTLAIRPEDVHPGEATGENVVAAEIEAVEFRGASQLVTLRLAGEPPLRVEAEMRERGVREQGLVPGTRVSVRLPADRLRVFRDPAAA
jgi:iron(III) transport system ATP-binding protein